MECVNTRMYLSLSDLETVEFNVTRNVSLRTRAPESTAKPYTLYYYWIVVKGAPGIISSRQVRLALQAQVIEGQVQKSLQPHNGIEH